jgi:hypothetical protein
MSPEPNLPVLTTCGPWATPADVTEVDVDGFTTAQLAILNTQLQAASDILYSLSGRQFSGSCQDTVRPNARIITADHGRPIAATSAWTWNGSGYGYYSGGYMSGFGYSRWGWVLANTEELPDGTTIPSINLGVFPLTSIVEILIDGQTVDPTTYRIDDNRHLVRVINPEETPDDTDNPGWPVQQRMDLPPTEKNTWQVTFTYGVPPPPSGQAAAAELGYQLYLAQSPTTIGQCRLPKRVTSISREGMTAIVLDPMAFLDKGRTGLLLCDYFIESVNSGHLRRRATVMSPDIGRRVRRTGPVGG